MDTDITKARRDTWETYAEAWKVETDAEKRERFRAALVERCTYTDPLTQTHGWDDLAAYMLDFHRQIPGGHFVTDHFLTHHDVGIAHWRMLDGNGTERGVGTSYCQFADDGRLERMTGFFEEPER